MRVPCVMKNEVFYFFKKIESKKLSGNIFKRSAIIFRNLYRKPHIRQNRGFFPEFFFCFFIRIFFFFFFFFEKNRKKSGKIGKNREKSEKIGKSQEKSGKIGKNVQNGVNWVKLEKMT